MTRPLRFMRMRVVRFQKWEMKLEMNNGKAEAATGQTVEFDHTEKIAAMRKAMFKDVDDLLASGKLVIPKAEW